MKRLVLLMVPLLLAVVVVNQAVADPPEKTRVVVLEPMEGSPWLAVHPGFEPSAKVTIHFWGNKGTRPTVSNLLVRGVRPHWRDAAYALYFTTRNSPAEYVHGEPISGRYLFNTSSEEAVYQNWVLTSELSENPPTITFFVAVEYDDGRPFMPHLDMDKVVFVGTSVLD